MPPARRFRLLDGMILIAAIATGSAASRPLWAIVERRHSPFHFSSNSIRDQLTCLVPIFLSLTVAMLVLQLLRPRPKMRGLILRPGFASAVAIISATIICFLAGKTDQHFGFLLPGGRADLLSLLIGQYLLAWTVIELLRVAGPAVAVTWVLLAIGGRWRRQQDSDWRELTARILGGCWLVLDFAVAIARWQS